MPTSFRRFAVQFVATLAAVLFLHTLASTNATAAVTATFKNKELTIWGDHHDNVVDISRIERLNVVVVEAKTGRTRKTMKFPDARKILINMSGGRDTVSITGNQLADFISVRSENILITDAMFAGDLQLIGSRHGYGTIINVYDTLVLGDTFIDGTSGSDWLRLEDSQFAGLFQADLGGGEDDVYLNAKSSNLEFGKLSMFLGGGRDAIFYTIYSNSKDVIAHDSGSVVFGGMYWETSGNNMYNLGWNSPADDDVVPNLGTVYGFDE